MIEFSFVTGIPQQGESLERVRVSRISTGALSCKEKNHSLALMNNA
jgi:hypothetical protein